MKDVYRYYLVFCALLISNQFNVSAQSYVTYNHDAAKMNQITVQEIGSGGLTPAFYYDVFHKNYQKTAASKNKLSYRSLAGIGAYSQVEMADSIETSLEERAEIEALNIADRQIDIAWLAEGKKINDKLTSFQSNINRILGAGGSMADKERWNEYYKIYLFAIKQTQDAYMPNAQRKKQYLSIYAEISKQNETLIAFLVQLNRQSKTEHLLSATNHHQVNKSQFATSALNRWRNSAWQTK